MVYLIPGFKERFYKIPTVIKTLKNYDTSKSILRIAASFAEFVEKIRILESGLDDRIIEVVKLLYSEMYANEFGGNIINILFEGFKEDQMHFGICLKDEEFEALLPISVYEQARIDFLPILCSESEDEYIVVDQCWLAANLTGEK